MEEGDWHDYRNGETTTTADATESVGGDGFWFIGWFGWFGWLVVVAGAWECRGSSRSGGRDTKKVEWRMENG